MKDVEDIENTLSEKENISESDITSRLLSLKGEEKELPFAKRCGIPGSTMRKYLRGAKPGSEKLVKIADNLGVNVEWLATGKGTKYLGASDNAGSYTASSKTPADQGDQLTDEDLERLEKRFREGLDLAFSMTKDDPSPNPAAIWAAVIMELTMLHGLDQAGVERLYEVLMRLKERNGA